MFRAFLILALSAPAVFAQTLPVVPPIAVTAQISPIDPQTWTGFDAGPGLFINVVNLSGRGVQGYAYETIFIDPLTGNRLEHTTHSAYKKPSLGIALAPGASQPAGRPYPMPKTASGEPARYAFTVDLVVFDDGTTWGPAKSRAAQTLLARMRGAPVKHGKPN